ncbi:MAG: hypothetical protein M9962_15265 [Oligoflexia bacterium]|nr:hypothetical protein [Oligoflexia bacterium]
MDNEIFPIGSCLLIDEQGFLVFNPDQSKLQQKWKDLLSEIVEEIYKKNFSTNLHSVYVRGTVAKGIAIDFISDIDTFAIIREGKEELQPAWSEETRNALLKKYSFATGIEIIVIPMESLQKVKPLKTLNAWHRLIKTQSLCVYGEDLSSSISSVRPGVEMVSHLFSLYKDLPSQEELVEAKKEGVLKKRCTWLMKRIVRSGFELVMEKEQTFTRDLYPCYELFIKHYPNREVEMRKALELAVYPSDDIDEINGMVNGLGKWLALEGQRWQESLLARA